MEEGVREKLQESCEKGLYSQVKKILQTYPFWVNECCTTGGIPLLIYAISYNRVEIVSYLLGLPQINVNVFEVKTGNTALIQACRLGRLQIISQLLLHRDIEPDQRNLEGSTALIYATLNGEESIVRMLLSHPKHGNINHQNNEGLNPLMYACNLRFKEIVERLLLREDIDVNCIDQKEETALHKACASGQVEIITLLLSPPSPFLRTDLRNKNHLLPEGLLPVTLPRQQRDVILELLQEYRKNNNQEIVDSIHSRNSEEYAVELSMQPSLLARNIVASNSTSSIGNTAVSILTSDGKSSAFTVDNESAPTSIDPSTDEDVTTSLNMRSVTYAFDVFLSHNWGEDTEKRDNHERVKQINTALKQKGLITWFDEEQMSGNLRETMSRAIPMCRKIVIFLTQKYHDKVDSKNSLDNCYFEFNTVLSSRRSEDVIVVVMEESVATTSKWGPRLLAEIGSLLYLKYTNDREVKDLYRVCDAIVEEVRESKVTKAREIKTLPSLTPPSGVENETLECVLKAVGLNEVMIKSAKEIGVETLEDFDFILKEEKLYIELKSKLRILDQHRLEIIRKGKLTLPSPPT